MFNLVVSLTLAGCTRAQTFQDFLDHVYALPGSARQAVTDSFLTANPVLPYLDNDTTACFIWKGNAQSVTVPGDANSWNPASFPMIQVNGTDFRYLVTHYESDARLDYKFVLNGSSWILDPQNPNSCAGGFGPNSELRMPDYVPPDEILHYPDISHGTLWDSVFFSTELNNSRTVWVYVPHGYSTSTENYPLILFHDGQDYLQLGAAVNILDYLIHHELIAPLIAVFIPPVNRTAEYAGSQKEEFTAFIVSGLMPWLEGRYRIRPEAEARAVAGASNGGNISLWMGWQEPEVFGKIAAFSGNVESAISSGFQTGALLDLKIYLDIGTYDISQLIPLVKGLRDILETRGYPLLYQEIHEGHSWGNWKGHLKDALVFLFPYVAPGIPERIDRAQDIHLYLYPNPARDKVSLVFNARCGGKAEVSIVHTNGKMMELPGSHPVWSGENRLLIKLPDVIPGMYVIMLRTANELRTAWLLIGK